MSSSEPSITPDQEKTQPESEKEVTSRDKLSMFLLSEDSTKVFTLLPSMPEISLSKMPKTFLSA